MKRRKAVVEKMVWLPAVLMTAFILALSSQDGQNSYYTSKLVTEKVVTANRYSEDMNTIIRTIFHILEYTALSLFIAFAVTMNGIRGKLRAIYMMMLSIGVAFIDEFYQIFIPARYGDWIDIIGDGFGAALAAIAVYAFSYGRYKAKLVYERPAKRRLFGITLDNITFEQATDRIIEMACDKKRQYVVTPNVDHVMLYKNDTVFREVYKDASLVCIDGTPLMWIAESIGYPITQKITGSDMFPIVCEKAAKNGNTVFLLGAAPTIADKARARLMERYEGLNIVGTYSPPIGFEKNETELEKIYSIVNSAKPDILVVGLGAPKQEKFIYNHRSKMNFGVALLFGAAIDFESGEIMRAPKWMRKLGLEWLFRFVQEPGRLFKRYFVDDMKIFWYAWKDRWENVKDNEDIIGSNRSL